MPEISDSKSVFPVRANKKKIPIVEDLIMCYQVDKAMKYESPINKYTYPFSTSSEIGWPWYYDPMKKNINEKNNISENNTTEKLPKFSCQSKLNISTDLDSTGSTNLYSNTSSEKSLPSKKSNSNETVDNEDDKIDSEYLHLIKNKRMMDKLQRHGFDQYRLGNVMKWWGGCIESLP